jgi:hypothetical protein
MASQLNRGKQYRCSICPPLVNPDKSFSHTLDGLGRSVRFATHRQPLCWNFMYHSPVVLSVGGSVWYTVRNHRCTVTFDSVLANFKTHNAFISTAHAIFRHDCPLAVKPANTPRRPLHKKTSTIFYLLICSSLGCCAAEV